MVTMRVSSPKKKACVELLYLKEIIAEEIMIKLLLMRALSKERTLKEKKRSIEASFPLKKI